MTALRHTCYQMINEALAEKGLRLSMCFQFSQTTGQTLSTPRIPVEPIGDSRAAKKAARQTTMLADFCPFCGLPLEKLP